MRSHEAIEDQISRYKALLWITSDSRTREALFASIRALQEEVEALAPADAGQLAAADRA